MGDESGTATDLLGVTLVYALPEAQSLAELQLPVGSTVADALLAVATTKPFDCLDLAQMPVGIYGELVARDRKLADHDRLELYRPLKIDPVEARRRRGQRRA